MGLAVDRFNEEHGTNVQIVRDEVLTHAMRIGLVDGLCRMRFSPMIVRGLLGHEAPDTPLGDAIVWKRDGAPDIVLPTGRHRGEPNVALWLPDPRGADIRRENGRILFDVSDDRLVAVPQFRPQTGLYRMEPHTRLPFGDPLPDDSPPTLTAGTGETFAYRLGADGRVELGPPPVKPDTLRYFLANQTGACVSAVAHGSIGNDPPIGIANGIGWSITAFVEITPTDAIKFRPRSLNDYEFTIMDLTNA